MSSSSLEITGAGRTALTVPGWLEYSLSWWASTVRRGSLSSTTVRRTETARRHCPCAGVQAPQVLLSDEATSALDPETTRQILDLIRQLSKDLGLTVLLITHEMGMLLKAVPAISAAVMSGGRDS